MAEALPSKGKKQKEKPFHETLHKFIVDEKQKRIFVLASGEEIEKRVKKSPKAKSEEKECVNLFNAGNGRVIDDICKNVEFIKDRDFEWIHYENFGVKCVPDVVILKAPQILDTGKKLDQVIEANAQPEKEAVERELRNQRTPEQERALALAINLMKELETGQKFWKNKCVCDDAEKYYYVKLANPQRTKPQGFAKKPEQDGESRPQETFEEAKRALVKPTLDGSLDGEQTERALIKNLKSYFEKKGYSVIILINPTIYKLHGKCGKSTSEDAEHERDVILICKGFNVIMNIESKATISRKSGNKACSQLEISRNYFKDNFEDEIGPRSEEWKFVGMVYAKEIHDTEKFDCDDCKQFLLDESNLEGNLDKIFKEPPKGKAFFQVSKLASLILCLILYRQV